MEFLHVRLNVSDLDEAVQFYTEELEFEETWGFEDGDTEHRYVADENGIELQLSKTEGQELESGNRWDHLAVKVDDVEAAIEEIDHYGLVKGPLHVEAANADVAFIEDPDGHVVELVQPLG